MTINHLRTDREGIRPAVEGFSREKMPEGQIRTSPFPFPGGIDSIPGFASMAHGQNDDLFPVVMIQSDVGSLPEFNHPLAELRRQLF